MNNDCQAPTPMPIQKLPINRRRFLAGSLAAGVGIVSSRWLAAAEPPKIDPNCFVLMADTHLMRRQDDMRRNIKPAEAFRQAVKEILELPTRPSGLIIAGDCAHENPDAYTTLRDVIKPLEKAEISMHFAPGNHDRRDKLRAMFPKMKFEAIDNEKTPSKLVSIWETPQANWFLLDSTRSSKAETGEFGEKQLKWLAKALDERKDKPALIVAHHHLDPLGKFNGASDATAFLQVVLPRKQVKAYFYGHTHFWGQTEISGIHLVNLPAMAWSFDPTQPRGYVTVELKSDGATLVLHTLDHAHARQGQKLELPWRK
jgi:3',5'-cyclic-AMP phosphodiesterase